MSRPPARLARLAFVALLVRPALLLLFGVRVVNRPGLPQRGPAVVVANHNSHLDTLLLLALFPLACLPQVRPVAAGDYFGRGRLMSWFTREIIGGILIDRGGRATGRDPLAPVADALRAGQIVIVFPEGTRGEPEVRAALKRGVAHLHGAHPQVPVVPVYLRGLGRALPKGDWLPVPLNLHAAVGAPLTPSPDKNAFMASLEAAFDALEAQLPRDTWD